MIKSRTVKTDDDKEITEKYISTYDSDQPMNEKEIVVAMELIIETLNINDKTADFICEILAEEQWSMRKLRDAIKYIIKTHKYKEVKPADILSYDKGVPFYSYLEMIELGDQEFRCVLIPGLPNIKRLSDSLTGETVDVGWYVRVNHVLPEAWQDWSRNATN